MPPPRPAWPKAGAPGRSALILEAVFEPAFPEPKGGPIAPNKPPIPASPARTDVYAPAASNRRATQTYAAWFEEGIARRSSFALTPPVPFPIWFFELASGAGAVLHRGDVALHIMRPLRASDTRIKSSIPAL